MTPERPVGVDYVSFPPGDGYGDAAVGYLQVIAHLGLPVSWHLNAWRGGELSVEALPDEVARGPLGSAIDAPVATDTLVVHLPPPELAASVREHRGRRTDAPYRRVIGLTTAETDPFPPEWLDHLRRLDAVVVPSTFNERALRDAAPELPVRVVPHVGVPVPPTEPMHHDVLGDRFVFYSIGPWNTRKGIADGVTAFLDAFSASDDVALVVKTSRTDHQAAARAGRPARQNETWWTLAHLLAHRRDVPPVLLITDSLTAAEVRALHARGDCLVSLNRGEGFGLTVFDAALAGNPVVATGWGGPLDFLGDDYPLLVRNRLITVADDRRDTWHPPSDLCWAKADHDHAVDRLRWVSDHRDAARRSATELRARVEVEFGLDAVASRFLEVLRPESL
jgi:glycosyltransferase involved in cell wall biosynthesis